MDVLDYKFFAFPESPDFITKNWEFNNYFKVFLKPSEKTAAIIGAKAIGLDDDIESVEAGKLANQKT